MTAIKRGIAPAHPGAILRKRVLTALNISVSQAARDMQMSRQLLHGILAETKPISPESALKIGKYCGNGPTLWINMQIAYDLHRAEQIMVDVLEEIPTAAAA